MPFNPSMTIALTGDCIDDFRKHLQDDPKIGITGEATTFECARDAVEKCVQTYSAAFGSGEVGARGKGRVAKPPHAGSAPPDDTTGLVYGKVQSGKTNASIATVALALANGFRCFVVLTSDNVLLGTQTYDRYRDQLQFGPTIYHWDDWRKDPGAFGKRIADRLEDNGVLFISTKNSAHLQNLATVLRAAGARRFPGLIIDDEADNSSLDTNVAKRARAERAGSDEPVDPSRIYELIGDVRREVHHHVYLQITATPQSLFLQTVDSPCRPRFVSLTKPGDGYVGGDSFFRSGSPYCVAVDTDEFTELEVRGKILVGDPPVPPKGLRRALAVFLLGSAQKYEEGVKPDTFSFLAHVSIARVNHRHLSNIIDAYIDRVDRALRGVLSATEQSNARRELATAYDELSRTHKSLKPLSKLESYLVKCLRNVRSAIINAETTSSSISYQRGPNIFVGANRLSRGVTINGLMVTYYGRDPKTKMMDTVHQHARMFGYRKGLLDVTRLYSTPPIISAFAAIHEADEAAREIVAEDGDIGDIASVWVGPGLKPTRANVLNPSELGVFSPLSTHYPWCPAHETDVVQSTTKKLDKLLSAYSDQENYYDVPLEFLAGLLEHLPSSEPDDFYWRRDLLRDALVNLSRQPIGVKSGRLMVRTGGGKGLNVARKDDERTDTHGGQWLEPARRAHPRQPFLLLTRQRGLRTRGWDDHPFYGPTLVFPEGRFAFVYSRRDS